MQPLHRSVSACKSPQTSNPLDGGNNIRTNEGSNDSNKDYSKETTSTKKMTLYIISLALLGLCVLLCTAGIISKQTPVAINTSPLIALVLMWLLIWWLGILEGGQGCHVGLQPVDPEHYKDTHSFTYKCTQLAHSRDNLNRFIVGRQFFVVLAVFLLNLICTCVADFVDISGVPHLLMAGLVASGLAVMIVTVMLGQLAAEVNATNCMFDFVNSRIVWITTLMCLWVEASGLLHSVYLVQRFFGTAEVDEMGDCKVDKEKTTGQKVLFWTQMVASCMMLVASLAVTCDALCQVEGTMYPGLTNLSNFALFFCLVCFLGLLEAIQIAAFAVVKLPKDFVARNPAAEANCKMVFRGQNFKALLIGRQIGVTTSMFMLAKITTTKVDSNATSTFNSTLLGLEVPAAIHTVFNTGLPGALITTIVASLWWRIAAASFPIAFMGNPIVKLTIKLCLFLEATGVASASWLLADVMRWLMGLKQDDYHLARMRTRSIGSDEELDKSDSNTPFLTEQSSNSDTAQTFSLSQSKTSRSRKCSMFHVQNTNSLELYNTSTEFTIIDLVPYVMDSTLNTPL